MSKFKFVDKKPEYKQVVKLINRKSHADEEDDQYEKIWFAYKPTKENPKVCSIPVWVVELWKCSGFDPFPIYIEKELIECKPNDVWEPS